MPAFHNGHLIGSLRLLVTLWRTTQGLLRTCFNRTRTLNPAGKVRIHKRYDKYTPCQKINLFTIKPYIQLDKNNGFILKFILLLDIITADWSEKQIIRS